MKKRLLLSALALVLILAALLQTGCTQSIKAADLMKEIEARPVQTVSELSEGEAFADFAVRLFQAVRKEGENVLISPYSVLSALAMTANGAKGETLSQMEKVLGMTRDELNRTVCSYQSSLSEGEKQLRPANSIWFNEDESFTLNREFLQTNADYYGADAYRVPFDQETCDEINDWVKQKTDGMIPEILDKIPQEAVMYLINALAFDAEWQAVYSENQVWDQEFTAEDGKKTRAEFLHGTEYDYLKCENAAGFLKRYAGGRFAFAALLPDEGVKLSDLVASLDGKTLHTILASPENTEVVTAIPKFKADFSGELSEALIRMGMPLAFDRSGADFSGIGSSSEGNLYLSRVLHKTYLQLDERGTKAGAVTAVEVFAESALMPKEKKEVVLDRPFVYMLIDLETNAPFFIGCVSTL